MALGLRYDLSLAPHRPDNRHPVITSPSAHSVNENEAYSATATADETVTWTKGGNDAPIVTLNTSTGEWSVPPQDFETKPSVVFTLTAVDLGGNASPAQTVTLTIMDVAAA